MFSFSHRDGFVVFMLIMIFENRFVTSRRARGLASMAMGVIILTSLLTNVCAQKQGADYLGLLMKSKSKAHLTAAMNNAKQLYLLMFEFDQDFGEFPNDKTAVGDLAGYKGKHSNDYLAQLIAGGYTKMEDLFYVKGGSALAKQADNNTASREKTLEAGECGFAYYKGLSIASDPALPLLMAPMTGKGFKFDPKPFRGRALVLHVDGSVRTYPIDDQGDAVLKNGKQLFEGGADTAWGERGLDASNLVFPR